MVETNVKVFVLCTAALYAKFFATLVVGSRKTFAAGNRSPEDGEMRVAKQFKVKQNYGAFTGEEEKDEHLLKAREADARWKRIVMNDLESMPLALFVFGGGVLAGSNPTVHATAMILYTVFRYAHTVAYANSLQPHRFLLWVGSALCTFVGVGNGIAAVL